MVYVCRINLKYTQINHIKTNLVWIYEVKKYAKDINQSLGLHLLEITWFGGQHLQCRTKSTQRLLERKSNTEKNNTHHDGPFGRISKNQVAVPSLFFFK